ncbi:MAG: M20/M25/M40 family metallo-hydrolase [Woeseiaceae bacterium]|jgi:acetylornithine deacetylase/succinyl-diaminopimelate desuccinylase-like protein
MAGQSAIRLKILLAILAVFMASCSSDDTASTSPDIAADSSPDALDSELLPHQRMARDFLRELIEIDTTQSTGNTTIAAEAMAAHLLAAGFAAEDVQVIGPSETRGNLVVRLRGRSVGRKPLLLLSHLDVVDADPADWTLDPFKLTEQDGYWYGRGTADDKEEAAIHLANLIRLKQEGFQPDRDIIVAATADEEGGTENGVSWLLENHRDLIDAEYAVSEGGRGAIKEGAYVAHYVQASEKVYQTFALEVTNPGGHSSLPVKDNAIYRLADALIRIRAHDFPVVINEISRIFFERSAELEEGELAAAMRGVLSDPPDPAAVAYLSPMAYYNARLRTTCVATMLEGGHAENALPQRARAKVNCRVLPGESVDAVQDALEMAIADAQVMITPVWEPRPSPPSPLTPEILGAIETVTEEMWSGVPVIPMMSSVATDGLFLRNAGIPVYGVSGIFFDIADDRRHGQDERIRIKSFFEGQEFLYRLMTRLSRSDEN